MLASSITIIRLSFSRTPGMNFANLFGFFVDQDKNAKHKTSARRPVASKRKICTADLHDVFRQLFRALINCKLPAYDIQTTTRLIWSFVATESDAHRQVFLVSKFLHIGNFNLGKFNEKSLTSLCSNFALTSPRTGRSSHHGVLGIDSQHLA